MHDPNILAFDIRYPWREYKKWPKAHLKRISRNWHRKDCWDNMEPHEQEHRSSLWPKGYRNSFISIWHKDPERDGSDDSCGWSFPKLTGKQMESLWNAAWSESKYPHFLVMNGKEWEGTYTEAVSLYAGMILMVVQVLRLKVSLDRIQRMAISRIHNPDCCPTVNVFCYQPGYHTNNKNDNERDRQEHFYGILCGIARSLLSDLRPGWKHPRWHFWHWRFQVHPWQSFYRWAFERCHKCGKGFRWNEPVIGDWNGTKIWHDCCDSSAKKNPTI